MKIQINKILKYKYIGIVFLGIFCLLLPQFSYAQCSSVDPGSWQGAVVSRGGSEVDRSCKAGSIDRGGPGRHATGVWCDNNKQFSKNRNTATYCASCRGSSLETCSRPAPGRILDLQSWQGEVVEKGGDEVDRSCKAGSKDRGGPGRHGTGVWCEGTQNSVYDGMTYCGGCKGYVEIDDPNQPPTANYTGTTDISYNTVKANWSYSDPNGDAQAYYVVQVATDAGFGNIVFSQAGLGGATNMAVNSLSSSTTYYPRVAVQDAKGAWSGWGYGSAFTTPNQAPTVSYTYTSDIGYNTARANWSYSDAGGDAQAYYVVQVATDAGFGNIVFSQSLSGNATNMAVNSLSSSTTYYPRVAVKDAKGAWSGWSYGSGFTTPNQAPTVSYASTTDISYNTAKANWSYSDPEGDAQATYAVQVATDAGFGNIVFSQAGSGGATNMAVNSLIPGTTYYPRVIVQDTKSAWSAWVNGPSFTTLANNPPNLDQLSCNGVSTGYTSGKVNWDYTGTDEPGDVLVFRLRYKKTTESVWTTVNLPTNRAGAQDIANLISGYGYNIEISLNDNRNVHLGDRWKGCGIFTTNEYPEPSVDFNLRSGSTTVAKGGTLTVKTGDPISTNWKITNTDGLNTNSCALSTTGVRDIFRENNIEFESSRQNNNIVADKADQTYTINLSCTGKDARVPKSVNANITLVIQSYPLISCRIVKKVVSTESPIAQVEGTISNANSPYTWQIKRFTGAGENYGSPITSTSTTQNFTLDYTGLGLGKYKPVIRANGLGSRISEKECGEISNFGNRSIQEVAK
jgi:hypothetical protein